MSPDDHGGDSACWLHLVCAACGAVLEDDAAPCPVCQEESPGT